MARSAFDPAAKAAAHSVSKSRRQDTAAGVAGAAVGARTAPSLHQRAQVRSATSHFVASQERERAAATVGIGRRHRSLLGDEATRRWYRGYQAAKRARSTPLRLAAGVAGAAAGGTGAVAASRAASRRRVTKSAFGAEHPVSKGVPTPARLRVVGPKPGQPVTPPQGAAPRPPLTQRLNNAVTATGGSIS